MIFTKLSTYAIAFKWDDNFFFFMVILAILFKNDYKLI